MNRIWNRLKIWRLKRQARALSRQLDVMNDGFDPDCGSYIMEMLRPGYCRVRDNLRETMEQLRAIDPKFPKARAK